MLTIFSTPTKQYQKPYGTFVKCVLENNIEIIYVQTACDDETPNWLPFSLFLQTCFEEFIDDKEFIGECFKLFEGGKGTKAPTNIISILQDN